MSTPTDDPAKRRFTMLQLLRLGGFIAAATGIWLWRDAVKNGGSDDLGRALLALGLIAALVAPALLARHWRSKV